MFDVSVSEPDEKRPRTQFILTSSSSHMHEFLIDSGISIGDIFYLDIGAVRICKINSLWINLICFIWYISIKSLSFLEPLMHQKSYTITVGYYNSLPKHHIKLYINKCCIIKLYYHKWSLQYFNKFGNIWKNKIPGRLIVTRSGFAWIFWRNIAMSFCIDVSSMNTSIIYQFEMRWEQI